MAEHIEKEYSFEEDKKSERSAKTVKVLSIFIVIALIAIAMIIGIIIGNRSGIHEAEQVLSSEATTDAVTTEPVTQISEKYRIGDYVITGADELRLRDDHNTNANMLIAVPRGARITVSDVYYDPTSALELQYWGLTSYLGHSGWIALYYTENAYSQSVIDSAQTTVPGETQQQTVATTAGTQQTVTEFVPGDYIVNTDSSLRIRQSPSVDSAMVETIPTGVRITVTEVHEDPSAQASLRYWGRVTYNNSTGWIAMFYLLNVPEEASTASAQQ